MFLVLVFPYTTRESFCINITQTLSCSYKVVGSLWSFVWDQLPATIPCSPSSPPPPLPFTWLPIHPSIWLISCISSCITSVICLLLLDISVKCYFNLTSYFFRKIKKKLQLLISDNANYFSGNTIGGSHNNGNSGWGYHNNGYYGKRDIGKCIHWSIILTVFLSRYVVVVGFSIHNQEIFLH